nr:B196 [uncultured bacterium]
MPRGNGDDEGFVQLRHAGASARIAGHDIQPAGVVAARASLKAHACTLAAVRRTP